MAKSQVIPIVVPNIGPLSVGSSYLRKELNDRFGGNRMSGIVVSPREPVVLLFHTEEPAQQFYQDGFDDDGVYWYSGEGTRGNMSWTRANEAIRNHSTERRDLLLFERVQRKGGIWQFTKLMRYFDHRIEQRPDKDGHLRDAIIFGLIDSTINDAESQYSEAKTEPLDDLPSIRKAVLDLETTSTPLTSERIRLVYRRSHLIVEYARVRAKGICEACNLKAPFSKPSGEPYLEVHHIDRIADGGADRYDCIAAICPNCHSRCHYSADRSTYNQQLADRIAALEAQLQRKS